MVAQIKRDLSALLRSGSTTMGDLWRSQHGWEPSDPDAAPGFHRVGAGAAADLGLSQRAEPELLGLGDDSAVWTGNANQLLLPEIQGIIRGEAITYRIPDESVPPGTWRAAIYGKGGGKLSRTDAKAQAKQYCKAIRIAAGNEDEAEAACIARWAATCSQKVRLLFAEAAA